MDEVIFLISLNLGPAAGPAQAITIALQLPIIETRVTILLGLARADGRGPGTERAAATAAGIRRGLLRRVRGPPGSMTQASSRSQWLRNWGNSWPIMAVGECG